MTETYKLCLTDVETTGLDPRTDSILQIAALKVELTHTQDAVFWQVIGSFECKITAPDGFTGSPYNSYDWKIWRESAVSTYMGLADYFDFLKSSSFGGQNPAFDHSFLDSASRNFRIEWPQLAHHRKLDVSSLALPLAAQGRIPGVSQKALAAYFDLGEQPHDALGDVWQSFEILRRLYRMSLSGMSGPKVIMHCHPQNPVLKVN